MSVQALLSYALTVPDLAAGQRFYTTFGLTGKERDGILTFRCEGRDQDQVRLLEGRRKQLNHLCFGTDAAGCTAIKARLAERHVEEIDPPHPALAGGIWFRDPDGNAVNVRIEAAKPSRIAPPVTFNTPGHYDRIGKPGHPKRSPVHPTRLGHVLLFTPSVDKMLGFYGDVLGMRLSDRSGPMIAFMHVAGGGDHHVVALLNNPHPGFHHASFEVESIDAIGVGAANVLAAGYRNGWGFGRHVIGSNFFHYMRDPWNSLAEYFCDIDQIPADGSWQAQDYPGQDSLYIWGPFPPEDFGTNFEAID